MDTQILLLLMMFFGGLVFILIGLTKILGIRWVLFVIEFIIIQNIFERSTIQKKFPPAKKLVDRIIGVAIILLGASMAIYSLSIQQ